MEVDDVAMLLEASSEVASQSFEEVETLLPGSVEVEDEAVLKWGG